jgi:hypothetical protein
MMTFSSNQTGCPFATIRQHACAEKFRSGDALCALDHDFVENAAAKNTNVTRLANP